MVAKSFPRKNVWTKNFHITFFGQKFLWLQNHLLGNRFDPKILIKTFRQRLLWLLNHFLGNGFETKIFIRNFSPENLCLQNNSLENRFETKIFITNFSAENFYCGKIISWEIGLNQKLS
jgi:hypothetical protein